MYISKLKLTHVRCYKEVIIDLEKSDGAFSLMLAGNNGCGKSAILRSIAMGLCDNASAGSLLREMLGDFIRKDQTKKSRTAIITIDLKDKAESGETANYRIETKIKTSKSLGFEVVEQELVRIAKGEKKTLNQEDFPWNKIFVTAYGAGLRTEGTEDYGQYFAADAVYSLFKYSWPMQNPELIWRRLREVARDFEDDHENKSKAEGQVDKNIKKCLLEILNLSESSTIKNNKEDVDLENNGIFITSNWGKQELSALGDGYRGLTTMIMDIISWQLLMLNNKVILEELESNEAGVWQPLGPFETCTGIVIIDEIEKHLHPRLQRLVVKKMKDVFPKIQFIISSHSPACVAGTADVEDEYMVYRTLAENGNNCVKKWNDGLSGLRTDQILEHFFQVPYINEGTIADIETYSELYLMGEDGRRGEEKTFADIAERLSKSSHSLYLELQSKLLDKIIKKQTDEIEKKIGGARD